MFDEIENKIQQEKKKSRLKREMIERLPQIYNSLYPSVTSIATETIDQLQETKEKAVQLKQSSNVNLTDQQNLVQSILAKIHSISKRTSKLIDRKCNILQPEEKKKI